MSYGRVRYPNYNLTFNGAAVTHLAEPVRGDFLIRSSKAPSSGPSGHLLPKGRRAFRGFRSKFHA